MLPNLLDCYSTGAISALQQADFQRWQTEILQPEWLTHQRDIEDRVDRACEFFEATRPPALNVTFPATPDVIHAAPPHTASASTTSTGDGGGVAIATGLGWMLGGPVGAAVMVGASYLLNQTDQRNASAANSSATQMAQAHTDAVKHYLIQFSTTALTALAQYESATEKVMRSGPNEGSIETSAQQYHLDLLKTTLVNLEVNL